MNEALDIVPGNTTPLEEAVLTMLDSAGRYAGKLAAVVDLNGQNVDTIPNDWVLWFVYNEGLDILLPYLSPRDALREGRPWLKELGSEAAIIRALSWVGQTGVKVHYEPDEDEHFDLFQVELPAPVTSLVDARKIAELICLSKASTDLLGRVRAGLDGDAFRLDHSVLDGPDLLDDWAGVRLPIIGPESPYGPITWSFGERRVVFATGGGASSVRICLHETVCMIVDHNEGFLLDGSMLDDEILEPADIAIQVGLTGTATIHSDYRQAPHPHRAPPGYSSLDFAPVCSLKLTRED